MWTVASFMSTTCVIMTSELKKCMLSGWNRWSFPVDFRLNITAILGWNPFWNHFVLNIFDCYLDETSLTKTSATVKFMTGSYLVVKLKGRILIQLEHHFLHLHVDILFVTYKTDSINHYNFYQPIKFNWPTDFFGIRHGSDCWGTFENIYICIWICSFQEIFYPSTITK